MSVPDEIIRLMNEADFFAIQKNASGRVTVIYNTFHGNLATSCSKKALSIEERLIECLNRIMVGAGKYVEEEQE